jgi:anaerobic magnesium-protoporphyrin IX monomethyl ester cyclase
MSMSTDLKLLVLNLPDPPFHSVEREYAGGFGVSKRLRLGPLTRPVLNLFMPYLAAVAEDVGCEYSIIDAQALGLSSEKTVQKVEEFDPDVAVSMVSLPSLYFDKKVLSDVKSGLPNATVVACGSVCNVMPEEVLRECGIDLAMRDYFPYVNGLRNLLLGFKTSEGGSLKRLPGFSYVEGSEVRSNPAEESGRDFTDYVPKYDALPLKRYQHFIDLAGESHLFAPLLGSRGCPSRCFYCPYVVGFGAEAVFEDPRKVVDQIEYLRLCLGVEGFLFRNQSFGLNRKWAERVCSDIVKRGLDVSWFCESRADHTTEDLLPLMVRSGCKRIHYGVETGDSRLITTVKPGVRMETVRRAFDVARKFGVWRQAHIILGLSDEDCGSLNRTHDFLLELDPDSVSVNFATPYPGTALYREALDKDLLLTHDWGRYSSFNVVLKADGLTSDELYSMARKIYDHTLAQRMARLLGDSPGRGLASRVKLLAKYYAPKLAQERLGLASPA